MPYPNLPPLVYPQEHTLSDGSTSIHYGLTKRERFAMAAMQGILANPNPNVVEKIVSDAGASDVREACIKVADTLIAELDKEAKA